MIQHWRIRQNLIGCWILACIAAWAFRWAIMQTFGLGLGDLDTLMSQYSTIEMLSRILHGAVFFLLVGLHRLTESFTNFHDCRE